MALYETFGDLQVQFRAQAGLSISAAASASAAPRHNAVLNAAYESLYLSYEWPHLRYVAPRIPLNAGQRFYDMPSAIEVNRIGSVVAWNGPSEYPLTPGIGHEEYAQFDSVGDVRYDPPMRYDLRAISAGVTQLEIWPVPATGDFDLEITGTRKCPKLVNSADICLLDSTLVALIAAADVLASVDKEQAEAKARAAQVMLTHVRSASVLPNASGVPGARVGLGPIALGLDNGRATVRVR